MLNSCIAYGASGIGMKRTSPLLPEQTVTLNDSVIYSGCFNGALVCDGSVPLVSSKFHPILCSVIILMLRQWLKLITCSPPYILLSCLCISLNNNGDMFEKNERERKGKVRIPLYSLGNAKIHSLY